MTDEAKTPDLVITLNGKFKIFCQENGLTDAILLARKGETALRLLSTEDDMILLGTLEYHAIAFRVQLEKIIRKTLKEMEDT